MLLDFDKKAYYLSLETDTVSAKDIAGAVDTNFRTKLICETDTNNHTGKMVTGKYIEGHNNCSSLYYLLDISVV